MLRAPHEVEPYHITRYRIERLWLWPAERLLTGGIGALPAAPLTDDAAEALPSVIARIDDRLQAEASPEERRHLMSATTMLMSLRHAVDRIRDAMKGASTMWNSVLEDSSIVQDWLARAEQKGKAEGKAEGTVTHARAMLLRQGTAKFGPADPPSAARIEASNIDQLDQLSLRLLTANSWAELLG